MWVAVLTILSHYALTDEIRSQFLQLSSHTSCYLTEHHNDVQNCVTEMALHNGLIEVVKCKPIFLCTMHSTAKIWTCKNW
jgi:hypothetical protein